MNCFNHFGNSATGICIHCNKALCTNCHAEDNDVVACKGICSEKSKATREYVEENIKRQAELTSLDIEHCIFCKYDKDNVWYLVANEEGYSICDRCIELAQQHVDWGKLQKRSYLVRKLLHFVNKMPQKGFKR